MIKTTRLVLRPTEPRDHAALRLHIADPKVMRYLLPIADDAAFNAVLARYEEFERTHGFTFWVVERRSDGAVLGVCGLKPGAEGTPIAGMVEAGWRFGREHWGQGYAAEAARAVLAWAWANTAAAEVVAITVRPNEASWRLMERIGMTRVPGGEFDHPLVPPDSPLIRHILYRIARP